MKPTFIAKPIVLATLVLACLTCAHAQSAADEAEMQTVQVKGVKDPAILPYKTAYELISKVRSASADHVQLLIRVISAKSHAPLQNLEIAIEGAKTHEKLTISADGYVSVPLNPDAYADGAEFVTNQKKSSLAVRFFLLPKLPADTLRYADIVDAIKAAQLARAEILPWYLRLVLPNIQSIGLCYPNNAQTVGIGSHGDSARAASAEDSGILENKVFCANFSAQEAGLAQETVLVPAAGWEAIFQ